MNKVREYTVVASQMATQSTLVVLLRDDSGRPPVAYEPGQYAAISFFRKKRPTPARCFSITSSPTEQGYLQFALKIGGDFTKTAAQSLAVGSKVIVEGPFGSFIFNAERDRSALLLAGGIGVTPFISMLRYAAKLQLLNNIMLVYSCHTQDDIPFQPELEQIARSNLNIKIVYAIGSGLTDKLAGQAVIKGRIDKSMLDRITSGVYTGRSFFVCGPTPFMGAVSRHLIAGGAPKDKVFTEAFAQGQKSSRDIRHNVPLQVYAMSGLSILLGTGTILVGDTAATVMPQTTASSVAGLPSGSQSSSRQTDISQTIGSLQNSPSSPNSSSTTTAPPATTQPPASSTNTTPPPSNTPPSSSGGGTSSGGSSGGGGTSTPPAAKPVAPAATLSASSTYITQGSSVTLSWSVGAGATAPVTCSASGGWSGAKSTSGSQTLSPNSTTTYRLTCSNAAGSSVKSVTVNVAPACSSTPSNPC